MKKHTIFIIIIIGLALGIGIWRDHQEEPLTESHLNAVKSLSLSVGTVLAPPQKLPEFDLIDMDGKPFTNAQLRQQWNFLFFGYTNCPNICPTTLNNLHKLSEKLHGGAIVQFVFVTIDPIHDTPNKLKDYLNQDKFNGTSILGVTGDKDKIDLFAKDIGLHIGNNEVEVEHIEHSGTVLLINPEGKLTAIFTSSEKTNAIAHDFKEIVHQYVNTA